jgi:hypothetical protein
MKKFGIMIIALALVVVGMAMAEPGIPAVKEVQGLSTTTTVIAMGNFNSASNVHLEIITGNRSLSEVPPLADGDDGTKDGVMYQSVYSEDTQNSELGYISYDKDLAVSTANKISGEYNVQAVKQITYLGIDASSVLTTDYMMVDGAGEDYGQIGDKLLCPFGSTTTKAPTFCNIVETGSSMNLKIANLNTQMGDRFIMKSADPGVEIYNNVGVGAYAADVPSKGSVSAYIKGSIKEGGRDITSPYLIQDKEFNADTGEMDVTDEYYGVTREKAEDLAMVMTFSESTSISGDITTFAKGMSYTSKLS